MLFLFVFYSFIRIFRTKTSSLSHRALSIQRKRVGHRSALPRCTLYGASTIFLHQRLAALRDPLASYLLVYPDNS